ncbi:MAG: hypothetical protein ACKO3H_10275 [Verrucomicrobiota bacterium]
MNTILDRLLGAPLFHREAGAGGAWQTIGWWEARRAPFNLILGIVGMVTVVLGTVAMGVANAFLETPIHRPDPPLFFFALVYAVMVNLLYTGGWVVELVSGRFWGKAQNDLAVLSFRLGLLLSVLVTLFPAVISVAFALHAILTRRPLIPP